MSTILIFENLIDDEKWSLAFEKGLLLIASYSYIEFGDNQKHDSKNFTNWFKTYAIDKFDCLVSIYPELGKFKLNNKSVTTQLLKLICIPNSYPTKYKGLLDASLEYILYCRRSTAIHTQSSKTDRLIINGKLSIFKLIADEDNLYEQKNNIICLCPKFFTNFILFSIKHYIENVIKHDIYKKERYEDFLIYNTDSVYSTLKIPPADHYMGLTDDLCVNVLRTIRTNVAIDVLEDSFIIRNSNYQMDIRYDQIKHCKTDENNRMLNIELNESVNGCHKIRIHLDHPKLEKIQNKIK